MPIGYRNVQRLVKQLGCVCKKFQLVWLGLYNEQYHPYGSNNGYKCSWCYQHFGIFSLRWLHCLSPNHWPHHKIQRTWERYKLVFFCLDLGYKEVCNWGVACSLLKLDGGWQATPSNTKFLIQKYIPNLKSIFLFLDRGRNSFKRNYRITTSLIKHPCQVLYT